MPGSVRPRNTRRNARQAAARRHRRLGGETLEPRALLAVMPIADINQGPLGVEVAGPLVELGGLAYFAGRQAASGVELWQSDGTVTGTRLVKDINPGPASASVGYLTVADGLLYFAANDGAHGVELWKSDGTPEGTVLAKDIRPGAAGSTPKHLAEVNGSLFFSANIGDGFFGLWKSDRAGTEYVQNSAAADQRAFFPQFLANVGGTLFFSAENSLGRELWKSDGTSAGTVLVKDIFPPESSPYGSHNSNPQYLTNVGGTLFFSADDGVFGRQLWKSNGTEAGTTSVQFVDAFPIGFEPRDLTNVEGTLFFTAAGSSGFDRRALWKTDGNSVGTIPLKSDLGPTNLTNVGGLLFFVAAGSEHPELWKSDGTPGGTSLLNNSLPTSDASFVKNLTNFGGKLHFKVVDFNGDTNVVHTSLWKSNGTVAGTALVTEIAGGNEPFYLLNDHVHAATSIGGKLFFSASRGANGLELWTSEGTADTTRPVPIDSTSSVTSRPDSPVVVGDWTYFTATDGISGVELWKTDGYGIETIKVADIRPGVRGSYPTYLKNVDGTLFFRANDGVHGDELWKTDGTAAGTVLVKDIVPGARGSRGSTGDHFGTIANVGGTLFFTARTDPIGAGNDLWKSDGTATGTMVLKHFADRTTAARYLTNVEGTLYFRGSDGNLWKSNGTEAGTAIVNGPGTQFCRPFDCAGPTNLTAVGSTLYFVANDGTNGTELWKTDGSAAGTLMVKDIAALPDVPVAIDSDPASLINVNGVLFFTADDRVNGRGIWRSDGTAAGTVHVRSLGVGGTLTPFDLFNVNGTVFFKVFNSVDGAGSGQLWKTNGTAAGTVLVKDIYPGGRDVMLRQFTSVNGKLVFSAADDSHGFELWLSDGTESGTFMIDEVLPGAASSGPFDLVEVSGHVIFSADDGIHGRELWLLPPSWFHNQFMPLDVDFDLEIAPSDALAVINWLNAFGPGRIESYLDWDGGLYDVDGDYSVSPGDVLDIINHLNAFRPVRTLQTAAEAEGESAAADAAEVLFGELGSSVDSQEGLLAMLDTTGSSARRRRTS